MLDVPVALVTDEWIDGFEEVILVDKPKAQSKRIATASGDNYLWHNTRRTHAYDLSPWDRTLMIDADFIMGSQRIAPIFETNWTFALQKYMWGVYSERDVHAFWPESTKLPPACATSMYWTKDAKNHFDMAQNIEELYPFYANMYGFSDNKVFRNDLVFAIVKHSLGGDYIPEVPETIEHETWDEFGLHRYNVLPLDHPIRRNFHIIYKGALLEGHKSKGRWLRSLEKLYGVIYKND